MPKVRVQLVKWGNSHAVRIPKGILQKAEIREGDELEVSVEDGRIALEPANPKLTLANLVSHITPRNLHGEQDLGQASGQGSMVRGAYVPDAGHLIKIDLDPRTRHEKTGWRPAIVLSPASYNRPTGLAIVAPITSHKKGYPFEVALPEGLKVSGVVLSDAIKNVDWRARNARFVDTAPSAIFAAVRQRLGLLLGFNQ